MELFTEHIFLEKMKHNTHQIFEPVSSVHLLEINAWGNIRCNIDTIEPSTIIICHCDMYEVLLQKIKGFYNSYSERVFYQLFPIYFKNTDPQRYIPEYQSCYLFNDKVQLIGSFMII
jgi:hypothetical protein